VAPVTSAAPSTSGNVDENIALFRKLLLNPSGVLYEDAHLQVGLKMEYQAHMGRISVFFGNKSPMAFSNFSVSVSAPAELKVSLIQPMASVVGPMTQLNQMYSVENLSCSSDAPVMSVSYVANGSPVAHTLKLPIVASKFIVPVELNGTDFFAKWKQIGGPPREKQAIFKTKGPIQHPAASAILSGFNFKVLEGVDPNPLNHVCAGIYSCTSAGKIGCLLRLEPNVDQQVRLPFSPSEDEFLTISRCIV
jgi:AP-2 complex subunit alpha